MHDEEARLLPVQLDRETLADLALTTWMTDAGPFDVLDGLEDRSGRVVPYEELAERGTVLHVSGIAVRARPWRTLLLPKNGRTVPRTAKPCQSFERSGIVGRAASSARRG